MQGWIQTLLRGRIDRRADRTYAQWLDGHTPSADDLRDQNSRSAAWKTRPLVSVCMAIDGDSDAGAVAAAIGSVKAQSYDQWELCVATDGSGASSAARLLEDEADGDSRIRVTTVPGGQGPSAFINAASGLAGGQYLGFLGVADLLAPDALFSYVELLQDSAAIDLFYCDEDVVLPDGRRVLPFLKPDWSPHTLTSLNYVTRFLVIRRELVDKAGGLRGEFDGAQYHDLLLRLADMPLTVRHVPRVLCSHRQAAAIVTLTAGPLFTAAGARAVADALARRGVEGLVSSGSVSGSYRTRYQLDEPLPSVEIVVPTRDRLELLRACVESVQSVTDYSRYRVTVLDNDSAEPATKAWLAESGVRVVDTPGSFNYSAIVNRGFETTDADFVLTLNNDTVVHDPDWLRVLVEQCSRPQVGAVGCRLVFPDGRPQHEGIALGGVGPASNLVCVSPRVRVLGTIPVTRDVSAVTGACALFRRQAWADAGGYDEELPVAFNDVDFCLRLRGAGYGVLYTPDVTVVHHESASRRDLTPPADEALFVKRWAEVMLEGDPYFPRHLCRGRFGYELCSEHAESGWRDVAGISLEHDDPGAESSD